MFNPPPEAAGLVTSGGTESILMACLSARQKAYTERRVTEPEMYALPTSLNAYYDLQASGSFRKQLTPLSEKPVSTSTSEHTLSPAHRHPIKSPSHPSPDSSTAIPFSLSDPRPTSHTG